MQWFQVVINGHTMVMKPLQLLHDGLSRVIFEVIAKGGANHHFWVIKHITRNISYSISKSSFYNTICATLRSLATLTTVSPLTAQNHLVP